MMNYEREESDCGEVERRAEGEMGLAFKVKSKSKLCSRR
jgi:hypothetical protein